MKWWQVLELVVNSFTHKVGSVCYRMTIWSSWITTDSFLINELAKGLSRPIRKHTKYEIIITLTWNSLINGSKVCKQSKNILQDWPLSLQWSSWNGVWKDQTWNDNFWMCFFKSECAFLKAQDWDWCNMLNINAMNRCRMANEMKQGSSVMWHNQLWLERENVPSYFSLESRYWRWSLFWSNVVIYVIRLLIAYSHPANHPKWSQQPKFPGQSRTNSTDS